VPILPQRRESLRADEREALVAQHEGIRGPFRETSMWSPAKAEIGDRIEEGSETVSAGLLNTNCPHRCLRSAGRPCSADDGIVARIAGERVIPHPPRACRLPVPESESAPTARTAYRFRQVLRLLSLPSPR